MQASVSNVSHVTNIYIRIGIGDSPVATKGKQFQLKLESESEHLFGV
jgi:hypothetical protein